MTLHHFRTERLALIRAHCGVAGAPVLFDEPGDALLDVPSGKTLQLGAAELEKVERRTNRETGNAYLALLFGDGRQLALTEFGIAFAPDLRNSGPLPDLPEAVCLRDFSRLLERIKHELYGHPERAPGRETAMLLMTCIAMLDGASAVGLEIGPEARELEHHLAELERRVGP